MTLAHPLDVFACPLEGVNLIEASAGTGKTWNICGLYLRLLLEQGRTVQEILVVTFTHAATAELRERIRSRIAETLGFLNGEGAAAGDPFVAALVAAAERLSDRGTLRQRLDQALLCFDEASIFTIHGFCQRALAGTPFAAGLPFALELVQDDAALVQEAANDFWRRRVAADGLSPLLVAHLLAAGDQPEKYAGLLRRALAKPLSRQRWPEPAEAPDERDERALLEAFGAAQALWRTSSDQAVGVLQEALANLNGVSYKPMAIEQGRMGWEAWFAAGDPLLPLEEKTRLYRASVLARGAKKGKSAPQHPFFDAAETLLALREDLQQRLASARLGLIRELIGQGAAALREEKRRRRVIGFDDMLWNVYEALSSGASPWLAGSLRSRYPAALIDEFQDTDPLQFAIFQAIYMEDGAGPVFLVGDPKQAIYSFRNADLHTYLAARRRANRKYTLAENQRSVEGVIRACNGLFGAHPRAFMLDGLDYPPVRLGAKPRLPFADATEPRAPFQVWLLPKGEDGAPALRAQALRRCTDATAAEIARLVRDGRAGRISVGGRGLRACDIAVLVRSHAQGRRIRQALTALGVGSVELSQASVFHAPEAEEVERILLAILEPNRDRLLRAALATEVMGCDALSIAEISADENRMLDCVLRFGEYRELWRQRGFGPMYRRFLHEEGAARRALARPDGERRLTNLLHLGELLHQAQAELTSPDALLRWLQARRRDTAAQEAAQLRLESDQNLVQIVTIHKSKGLEYPVVFCPYLWDGHRSPKNNGEGVEYHDADGLPMLDFRPEAKEGSEPERRLEDDAETLRLIYVALTRAVYRCYLFAGIYGKPGSAVSYGESTRSMLNWLVCGQGHVPGQWRKASIEPAQAEAAWVGLASAVGADFGVAAIPRIAVPADSEPQANPNRLAAQTPSGRAPEGWALGSFTSLSRAMDTAEGQERDHDALSPPPERGLAQPSAQLAETDILRFPRGASAGICIHHLFEHADFADPASWDAAIERALAMQPQSDAAQAPAMLRQMLNDVLATDLGAGLRLNAIGRARRLNELPFHLPAQALDSVRLTALLREHGYRIGALDFRTLSGYLRGAIDLVFREGDRYYLLDWKSNHLGYGREDYARPALEEAMAEQGYHLQHLLYTVVLSRYLRRRLPDYDYARHFGGTYYLFVRGVRPDWGGSGVYFHQPAEGCIAALDGLIGGRPEP